MAETEEKTVKTLPLANGLAVELLDLSRKISEDAWQVGMMARIHIDVGPHLSSLTAQTALSREQVVATVGPRVTFVQQRTRNFIMAPEKESLFTELSAAFLESLLPYVSKPVFPEKFILKQLRDKGAL